MLKLYARNCALLCIAECTIACYFVFMSRVEEIVAISRFCKKETAIYSLKLICDISIFFSLPPHPMIIPVSCF